MLEITKEGRATVASQEFAEHISQMINTYHQRGESEEDIENMCRLRIGLALVERDDLMIDHSEDKGNEIAAFMVRNIDEIETAKLRSSETSTP
jgi:hypothetical protein